MVGLQNHGELVDRPQADQGYEAVRREHALSLLLEIHLLLDWIPRFLIVGLETGLAAPHTRTHLSMTHQLHALVAAGGQ